jgi:hypothetical protein
MGRKTKGKRQDEEGCGGHRVKREIRRWGTGKKKKGS